MTDKLEVAELDTPFGPMSIGILNGSLCTIETGPLTEVKPHIQRWVKRYIPQFEEVAMGSEQSVEMIKQLKEYFAGERKEFTIPLRMLGTGFQRKVWQALCEIPYGETRSYKDIAAAVGSPGAVRAVGGANGKNPMAFVVPCHRVIAADGKLGGYSGGLPIKRALLRMEQASWKE